MSHPGSAIRGTREGLKLSLRRLAELSDTSPSYLSLVERGEREPSARWLRAVQEALVDYMLDGDKGAA